MDVWIHNHGPGQACPTHQLSDGRVLGECLIDTLGMVMIVHISTDGFSNACNGEPYEPLVALAETLPKVCPRCVTRISRPYSHLSTQHSC